MKKSRDGRSTLLLRPSTYSDLSRYFLAVVSGFCVDFLIYAAIVVLGHSVYLANLAGFCVGTVINVVLIRVFVFPDSRFRLAADISLTFAANGAMLVLGMGALWLLVEVALVNPYWAKLLTNGTTFALNFITRTVIFRNK